MLLIAIPVWLASAWLSDEIFGGALGATIALPLFALIAALQALQRGSAVGVGRFDIVGLQLSRRWCSASDPGGGNDSSLPGLGARRGRGNLAQRGGLDPGCQDSNGALLGLSPARSRVVPTVPVVWLLAGSLGPVLIGNLVVPWFAANEADPLLVGGFGAALTISRIPTQFVSAAFAPIMVSLATLVEAGDEAGHRRDACPRTQDRRASRGGLRRTVLAGWPVGAVHLRR